MPFRCVLSESYQFEIAQAFDIFDDHKIGCISINSFKLLVRALGFRTTKNELLRLIHNLNIEKGVINHRRTSIGNNDDSDEDDDESDFNNYDINLETVLEIMSEKYKNRDPIIEMKTNFRLFDIDNKGFITFQDLKRVVNELNQDCQQHHRMGTKSTKILDFGEEQLKSMIEEFDRDLDGVLDEKEFMTMMLNHSSINL